jgi:hypothetical protein
MTVGELKKSLTRFPADMDDAEILMSYVSEKEGSKEEFDLLTFVAYSEIKNNTFLVLGSLASTLQRKKEGKLKFADGSNPELNGLE